MKQNPLLKLESFGQSIWMDFIRRGSLTSGELRNWIDEDGASGVTSNPSIFEKAIGESHDYDAAIHSLALEGKSVPEIYQALTVDDIQHATDLFRPLYNRLQGADGFASLEVSPHLAHDTDGTIDEARRLWAAVNRPNVMIKVPATPEGIPAIRQLISEGINVNITLLFGLPRYQQVIEAYIAGLEMRAAQGKPVDRIASVASFFLSRIDVVVDPILENKMKAGGLAAETARALHGQVAIASAKMAYQINKKVFNSSRFLKLAQVAPAGARTQRLLWASTGTKNPSYSDVKYIEALIGPDTINTVPVETFNDYREHGNPASRITEDVDGARKVLEQLPMVGVDLGAITQQLEDEGVEKFNQAFDQLAAALEQKRTAALSEPADH
jgi:transaldolase